jgi:hypothetical protein
MLGAPGIAHKLWVVLLTYECANVMSQREESGRPHLSLLQVAAIKSQVATAQLMYLPWTMPSKQCFLPTAHAVDDPEDKAGLLSVQSVVTNTSHACNWDPTSVEDLTKNYDKIFAEAQLNRNAASHLWAHFILNRSTCLTHKQISLMFSGFCAVSGSPLGEPSAQSRFRQNLQLVGGGSKVGYSYHCCWPCYCDEKDYIKVDTKTVKDRSGKEKEYFFEVIGDPCKNSPKTCSGEDEAGCIPKEAPGVQCQNEKLKHAILSDGGHPIIGMYFTDAAGLAASIGGDEKKMEKSNGELGSLNEACSERIESGMQTGMGTIFVNVAKLNPLP